MRVDIGDLTQGQIIAFVNYMTQILLALIVVSNLVVVFTKASASAARVNEVFDTKCSILENPTPILSTSENTVPKIEFKNVSFSYEGSDNYSLENISFSIYPKETVGIIGGTGAGKSTLINLISRFYDTSVGDIIIDGHDLKGYPLHQLRKKISVVPQVATLFTGSIAENMKLGNPEASENDIKSALEIAQASEFVNKLPQKYETLLDQGGKNLSGGQKQRLTIARALICKPEILILDDSFSALDFATDAALRNALKNETKDTTTIIVSQRIATIKNADKILVLDDGKLIDIGNHEELFNRCDIYKEIYVSQTKSKNDR
jgi:ATP-binding cassette subfamily B protein